MTIANPAVSPLAARMTGPEPMWTVVELFPPRGQWTEEDYFALNTNRLVELVAGSIEVLPMPTELHQEIAYLLCTLLKALTKLDKAAKVLMAPFSIRLWPSPNNSPGATGFDSASGR